MTLLNNLLAFMSQGGPVLWAVFATSLLLWLLIFERSYFYRFEFPALRRRTLNRWQHRTPQGSSELRAFRRLLISELSILLNARLKFITAMIMICPLMGLLGTVTGMIHLFDVIAFSGNGDIKAISSGIYRAILPTLAGLVTGLSGYYFAMRFAQKAQRLELLLTEQLSGNA